jgi:hypothetical protein
MLTKRAISRFWESNQRKHHYNYRGLFASGEMEPLMDKLSDPDLEGGFIQEAHDRLGFPTGPFRFWRNELMDDSTYRPYGTPANLSQRALTQAQEQRVYDKIKIDYIDRGCYCPSRVLQYLAVREFRRGNREDDPDKTDLSDESDEDDDCNEGEDRKEEKKEEGAEKEEKKTMTKRKTTSTY